MGTYRDDRAEAARRLRKAWNDKQWLELAETIAEVGPDMAVGELALPAVAAAGAVAGGLLGVALAGPLAPLGVTLAIGAAVGAGVGAAVGVVLGQPFYHWYRYEATSEERARLRALGVRVVKGGGIVLSYVKGASRVMRPRSAS